MKRDFSRAELFRALFRDNFLYVCACLRRFGVHASDVEDAAHDVFLTAYRRLDQLVTVGSPQPWLTRIAYLTALSSRPGARRWIEIVEPSDMPPVPDERPPPDELLELEEERLLVLRALSSLPPERRVVFVMHDIDGYSMPEIADALSMTLNTAYSRLRLARAEFRQAIERITRRASPLPRLGFAKV